MLMLVRAMLRIVHQFQRKWCISDTANSLSNWFTGPAAMTTSVLDAEPDLGTLSTLPGNRLEALKGNRKGQHSIRVNDPWRIYFVWREGHAYQVEIVDYH